MVWELLLFSAINVAAAFFGRRVVNFSGFEINAFAITVLAWNGYSVLIAGLIIAVSYSLVDVRDMQYLWLTIPATIIVGYLALLIPNAYVLIFIYHTIGGIVNYAMQRMDFKYIMFIMMNIATNFMMIRLFSFML